VHGLFLLWNLVSHDYFIVSTMLVFAALWCRHECGMNPRSDGCTLFLEGKPSSRSSFRAILQCHATWFSRKIERVSEWSGPLYSARDREVSSERKILLGLDCCKTTTRVVDYGPIVDRYHQPISERKRRIIVFAVLPYVDGLFCFGTLSHASLLLCLQLCLFLQPCDVDTSVEWISVPTAVQCVMKK
jgi:hypothetical protein